VRTGQSLQQEVPTTPKHDPACLPLSLAGGTSIDREVVKSVRPPYGASRYRTVSAQGIAGGTYTGDEQLMPPVTAADPHLLDTDLGGRLSEPQEKHLACCGWCQQRLTQETAHPDLADEDEFVSAAKARIASDAGTEMKRLTTVRPSIHRLTLSPDSRDDVKIGQLWRLRWRETTDVALVVALDRWWVTVAPVTTDVAAADEYSVVLPKTATVLNVSVAVCFSLECVVPLFTFDQLIAPAGQTTTVGAGHLKQLPPPNTLHDVWRAWRHGIAPPHELAYGQPLLDGDLDRRKLRSTLAVGFLPLVGASALAPGEATRQSPGPLSAMLQDLHMLPSELARQTRLEPEVFLRVKQGGRVNHSEAHALASILDTDTETVLAANPPLDTALVVEVSRPKWRPNLRRLAELRHTSEDDERWSLADAVAAAQRRTVHRPTGINRLAEARADQSEPAWTALVQMHLVAELRALGDTAERP
jgi:hypothetical protein